VDTSKTLNYLTTGLNDRQKEAVLSEHNRLLVLAGAGSGKTKTLIQKVLYLIFEKNVDPSSILAVTFTKNAANEMMDRLIMHANPQGNYKSQIENKKLSLEDKAKIRYEYIRKYKWISNLSIKTFHSFCYSVLRNHGAKSYDNRFKLLVESHEFEDKMGQSSIQMESPKNIIQQILKTLSDDSTFLLKLKQYILDYYVDKIHARSEHSPHQEGLLYTTLRGEKVRSKSERLIADWFHRHEINYEYEPITNITGDFSFHPDFYIPEANVYIEHVSNLSHSLKEKEKQFNRGDQLLVKTYENMTHDIRTFYCRLEQIVSGRLNREIKPNTSLRFEHEFLSYKESLSNFVDELLRLIDKIKSGDLDSQAIIQKGIQDQHDRVKLFYELLEPVYKKYKEYCIENSYLDFNDLLIETINAFSKHKDINQFYSKKLNHLLVDEFQDVNSLQVRLVDLLLRDGCNLFCVGDDWQSIYGFRGSEVGYIIDFEKYFDNSKTIHLDINYRSNDTIVKASNRLISHNQLKIKKEIRSFSGEGKLINVYLAQLEGEDGVKITSKKINQLFENGYQKEDILILYRRRSAFYPYWEKLKDDRDKFSNKTIHGAKGLEAKVVFIVGLVGSDYGFPFLMESDRIFQIIKPSNTNLLLEEERRLFYVAMTRAKEQLYLISELGNESKFIDEITEQFLDRENFLTLNFEQSYDSCQHCGFTISRGFKYCPECGSQITTEYESAIKLRSELKKVSDKSVEYDSSIKEANKPTKIKRIQTKGASKELGKSENDLNKDVARSQSIEKSSNHRIKENYIEKVRQKYPNAYKQWTKRDDNDLKELFLKDKGIKELAKYFGRNEGAIRARIELLKLDQ